MQSDIFEHETSVPKLLNFQQKEHRETIVPQMLTDVTSDPDLLKTVIPAYQSKVYDCDIETKTQSSHWKFSGNSKLYPVNSEIPSDRFLRLQWVSSSLLQSTRGTIEDVLLNLREIMPRKWPEFWRDKFWIFQYGNASVKIADTVVMPPYFPDMAPCDFVRYMQKS